ncbi:hypothetical protein F4054_23040 [Candidatus Poribacteria bacterium]|nr:hypothetical protein [Candidatus Poribacteria bacterium]MYG05501.1 hypothetical protein [Candidatus Poribacteria bacterium]MYK25129.1 hypothetical protein [Candidatus Poribacteria bacterium]
MTKIDLKPLVGIHLIMCTLLSGFLLTRTHTPAGETPRENSRPALQIWTTRNWGQSRHTRPQNSLTQFQETDFYRTIIENNLFRPLGWTPPRPREPYRLLGTIIPTDAKTPPKAIIQNTVRNQTHIVTISDTLDTETHVTNIQTKHITLKKNGQQRQLTLKSSFLQRR